MRPAARNSRNPKKHAPMVIFFLNRLICSIFGPESTTKEDLVALWSQFAGSGRLD